MQVVLRGVHLVRVSHLISRGPQEEVASHTLKVVWIRFVDVWIAD